MKRSLLTVPWKQGLHLRPAARLVKLTKQFSSSVLLKANGKLADARSILSVMLLCASLGTVIEVEAIGEDEELAIRAVENAFVSSENPNDGDLDTDDQQP